MDHYNLNKAIEEKRIELETLLKSKEFSRTEVSKVGYYLDKLIAEFDRES